ncbi:MAG TPA: TolC family protein [Acidobacteriaceae bacterium]|nr:TolC family protein [Acidobacteriaceae bacterium]
MQIETKFRISSPLVVALLLAATMPVTALAQVRSHASSAINALYGSVSTTKPVAADLPLSLDDAIHRGLQHNLQLAITGQDRRTAAGVRLQAINALLPTITWDAVRSRQQIDLAALGFRSNVLHSFPPGFVPPSALTSFQPVVTVNLVQAQANLNQSLFDLRAFELYRAARQEIRAIDYSDQGARQDVIQVVAGTYLLVLADEANVTNAQSLLATNTEILRQASLSHQAGVSTKLDELRAEVQYQQQDQLVIARQNQLEKDEIALKREIGLPADQVIHLTDKAPYADFDAMPLDQARRVAYAHRQDYLQMQARLRSAQFQSRAARFERLPTLSFGGNYGVTGTVGGLYHGTFLAQGTLSVPLFREAKFRGDRDVADARTRQTLSQMAALKNQIDAELRDDMLDIAATQQLVQVARSNVDLSQSSLSDSTERYKNGIADNLEVVQAQAVLSAAQAQMVNSLYQFNQAKLSLARNMGMLDAQYRTILGTSAPAPAGPVTTSSLRDFGMSPSPVPNRPGTPADQ